jgi:hypothetical protein
LQSLAPIPVSRRVDVRQMVVKVTVVKIIDEPLSQQDVKDVVPTPRSETRIGKRVYSKG